MNNKKNNISVDDLVNDYNYAMDKETFLSDNFINNFKTIIDKKSLQSGDSLLCEKIYNSSNSYIYYPYKKSTDYKTNILLVSHELSRTGAPIVVLDTAKILVKNGYFVTVVSLKDGPLTEEFLNIGVPVIIMPEMRYIQYLKSETNQFLLNMDLDIFVNSFDITIMVTATLYNFVRRYFNTNNKIFWWIHEGCESYNILDSGMPRTITPNVKVLCGGQYAADQLSRRGYCYYPSVLNYGVFDDRKKTTYNKNNKIRFLLAGTIGKRKGQLILLNAIKMLSKDMQNKAEFIFIGDPYEGDYEGMEIKEQIKDYAKDHNNVKLLKSITRKELYELYEKIDVLVLASIDDPMPVVATENFMLGNICLCSNQTGTSYYIEDQINGFVFQSGDCNQLFYKLYYIIKNKEKLDAIKEKGRKIYEDYFEMGIFEKKIIQLIEGSLK